MRITRYLIGIFVVLFTFSTVIAQEQGEGSRRERPARGERRGFNPEQMIQAYKERLNLTDKQVEQLKEIFKEPLRGMTQIQYRINGPWEDPAVERVAVAQAEPPTAEQPAAEQSGGEGPGEEVAGSADQG